MTLRLAKRHGLYISRLVFVIERCRQLNNVHNIIHHAVQARYNVLLLSTSKLLVITSLIQLAWAGESSAIYCYADEAVNKYRLTRLVKQGHMTYA